MKIKSHKLNWAMALCAIAAVYSTATCHAQARILPPPIEPPIIKIEDPATTSREDPATTSRRRRIEPLPPAGVTAPVKNGTFKGTVIGD